MQVADLFRKHRSGRTADHPLGHSADARGRCSPGEVIPPVSHCSFVAELVAFGARSTPASPAAGEPQAFAVGSAVFDASRAPRLLPQHRGDLRDCGHGCRCAWSLPQRRLVAELVRKLTPVDRPHRPYVPDQAASPTQPIDSDCVDRHPVEALARAHIESSSPQISPVSRSVGSTITSEEPCDRATPTSIPALHRMIRRRVLRHVHRSIGIVMQRLAAVAAGPSATQPSDTRTPCSYTSSSSSCSRRPAARCVLEVPVEPRSGCRSAGFHVRREFRQRSDRRRRSAPARSARSARGSGLLARWSASSRTVRPAPSRGGGARRAIDGCVDAVGRSGLPAVWRRRLDLRHEFVPPPRAALCPRPAP